MNVSRHNFVALATAAEGLPLLAEDKSQRREPATADYLPQLDQQGKMS